MKNHPKNWSIYFIVIYVLSGYWQSPMAFYSPVQRTALSSRKSRDGANFKCENCGRTYLRLYCLNRHLRLECGKPPKLQCHICHGWFKHKHNLAAHLLVHKTQAQDAKFTCTTCLDQFFTTEALIEHIDKNHTNWRLLRL